MRLFLTILLILFASYADIYLYRKGIMPVTPAYFLIPLFMAGFVVMNNPLNYLSLVKTHTFKFFLGLVVLSIVFANVSDARPGVMLTVIVLSIISLLLYTFSTHFFRMSNRFYLGFFLVVAFLTLAGSLWYDTFKGLPVATDLTKGNIRKGGFGENPNTAASGLKFLGLALLFFFRDKLFWRYFFLTLTVASVFLTFSRSGIISILIIIMALTLNNWKPYFNLSAISTLTKGAKAAVLLVLVYAFLFISVDFLQARIPQLREGDIAVRIDQLLGRGDQGVTNSDDNSTYGRNTLRKKYTRKFLDNPVGHGTAFATDPMLNLMGTHNYYLNVAVDYGFIGLLLFLYYLFRCIKIAFQKNQYYHFVLGLLLLFEGLISHGMFEERAILLTLAFFDSFLYPYQLKTKNENVEPNDSLTEISPQN